jgi:hypothetical protein
MKKTMIMLTVVWISCNGLRAQDVTAGQIRSCISRLAHASVIKDYQQLSNDFLRLADAEKTQWLPYYYAAYCNARIGWLKQEDPDNIDFFADQAEQHIRKAQALLDTATQKRELSEICCVYSMLNRARVFMNPATYGPKYGPAASRYIQLAISLNPDNPRALYLEGWEKFTTPKMWGGDKMKAKELLESAKQKLQTETDSTQYPHWGKMEVETLLRQIK